MNRYHNNRFSTGFTNKRISKQSKKKRSIAINRLIKRKKNYIWRQLIHKNIVKNKITFRDRAVTSKIVGDHIEIEPVESSKKRRRLTKKKRQELAENKYGDLFNEEGEAELIEDNLTMAEYYENKGNKRKATIERFLAEQRINKLKVDTNNNNNNNNNKDDNNNNNKEEEIGEKVETVDVLGRELISINKREEIPLRFKMNDPTIFEELEKERPDNKDEERLDKLLKYEPHGDTEDDMIKQEIEEIKERLKNKEKKDINMKDESEESEEYITDNDEEEEDEEEEEKKVENEEDEKRLEELLQYEPHGDTQDEMIEQEIEEIKDRLKNKLMTTINNNNNSNKIIKSYLNQQVGFSKEPLNSPVKFLKKTNLSYSKSKRYFKKGTVKKGYQGYYNKYGNHFGYGLNNSLSTRKQLIQEMYKIKNYIFDTFDNVQSLSVIMYIGESSPFLSLSKLLKISPSAKVMRRYLKSIELCFVLKYSTIILIDSIESKKQQQQLQQLQQQQGIIQRKKITAFYIIVFKQSIDSDTNMKKIKFTTIEDINEHNGRVLYKELILIDKEGEIESFIKSNEGKNIFKISLLLAKTFKWTDHVFPEIVLIPTEGSTAVKMEISLLGDVKYTITNMMMI